MTYWQSSQPQATKKQLLILFLAAAVLYLPAVWGAIVTIDDVGILKFYGSGTLTIFDVLRPGDGYYYRPVIAFSYYLDHLLWGQNPYMLHLENVLIHATNVVLVYLLAVRLFPASHHLVPVLSSLLFAVHPANSEAVCWIAGRTDPLATLFVLLSALSLAKGMDAGGWRYPVQAVLLLLAGCLAKETAFLFVPGSLLLVRCWSWFHPEADLARVRWQGRALLLLYLGLALVLAGLLTYRLGPHHNSLQKFLTGHQLAPVPSLLLAVKVIGFYLKTLVFPWPLNFAIVTVSEWFLVPGCIGLILLVLAWRRDPCFLLLGLGGLFLLPPLAVALSEVAWTVVAERYLYLPSAFICMALVCYLHRAAERLQVGRLLLPVLLLCIALGALLSVQRSLVWHSNLALFQDTVRKTPEFGMLRNELAVALFRAGRKADAMSELDRAAKQQNSELVQGLIAKNRVLFALPDASPDERRRLVKGLMKNWSNEEPDLLVTLRRADYEVLKKLQPGPEKDALVVEMLKVSDILYAKTRNGLYLYNNGQLLLERGDLKQAAVCFARSYRAAPADAYYRNSARRLAEKLGGGTL